MSSGPRFLAAAIRCWVLLSSWSAAPAFAQSKPVSDAGASDRGEARALAERGLAALDSGKYDRAVELLTAAEAKFHAPTHLLFIAQAHLGAGRLAEALRYYDAVANEVLPNYAPNEFREAQELARTERVVLVARVPLVKPVGKDGRVPRWLTATTDGSKPLAVPEEGLRLELGAHEIVFHAGAQTQKATVELEEGEIVTIPLTLSMPPALGTTPGLPPQKPEESGPNLVIPGVIVLSAGVAALAIGGVTGALSLSEVSDLEARCPTKVGCASSDEQLADDAKLFGNVSTASFVIGGVASAAGIILLAWPTDEPKGVSLAPVVHPRLGFLSVGVEGTF